MVPSSISCSLLTPSLHLYSYCLSPDFHLPSSIKFTLLWPKWPPCLCAVSSRPLLSLRHQSQRGDQTLEQTQSTSPRVPRDVMYPRGLILTPGQAPGQVKGRELHTGRPGIPRRCSGKESSCQCRRRKRHGFHPWVRTVPRSKKWQLTPIFLPGKSHGQRSLVSDSPRGLKESNTTE